MASEITGIYRRTVGFVKAMPLLAALPFVLSVAQRASSLVLPASQDPRPLLVGFTAISTLAMLVVSVFALRWWRFDGDRAVVHRIGWPVVMGAVAMLVIQLFDEFLFTMLGAMIVRLTGGPPDIILPASKLAWLFVSIPLFPWYVAMITDDRTLTLRQSLAAIRPNWLSAFGVVLGAILPLVAIGLVLRLAAMSFDGPIGWAVRGVEAVLVPLLIVTTASAYFAIYRRVRSGVA